MFKRLPFQLMKVVVIFIISLHFFLLFPRSPALGAEMTFNLVQGFNGISLPFENIGITNAEELCQSVLFCDAVSYWDAQTQKFVTHVKGSTENNFPLTPGYPYFVDVVQDTSWTVSGTIPEMVIFDLITTIGTDINAIALPSNMSYIRTAEDLVNAIPNADTVWDWDAAEQGYIGHPKGTPINNFNVYPGYPYFVNVTADVTWIIEIGLKAKIRAIPTKGAIPLEVQLSAMVRGGTPPYTYSWDIDGNGTIDDTRQSFNHIYQAASSYSVTLTVRDAAGTTAQDMVIIYALTGPTVVASADPNSGGKPLNVAFSATANDPDGTIVLYEWDFNGDGTYDYSSTSTPNTSFIYTANGAYHAKIRVTDNDGLAATDTVTIAVGAPPSASADGSPVKGTAPLTVNFTGTGSDTDGTVVSYEWDFNGDGIYDWSSNTVGNTTYIYSSSGIFNASLRVTDNDGLTGTASVLISVSGPPIALPRAYPTSGNVPLTVTFFSDGKDLDGSPEYYDWDFNGDGVYDQRLIASMNTTYTYTQPGTYNATLKVTDNEGLASTASIQITVVDPNPQGYPTATASAVPDNGGAPLSVVLVGSGSDPDGSIVKYEWDFEGDGVYDWSEDVPSSGPIALVIDVGNYSTPVFVDIDNDGDPDLFAGESAGRIYYYRNDGSRTAPSWTPVGFIVNSAGTTIDVGSNSAPTFVDIDGDGDFDLFIGEYYGKVYYYRNDGSKTSPVWTPVGAIKNSAGNDISIGYYSAPTFVDIDGDGDFDLFIGEYYGNIYYYRNDGSNAAPLWIPVGFITDSTGTTINVGYSNNPTFVDIDNDGDFDLFVGESAGRVYYYRNDGDNASPVWTPVGWVADSTAATIDVGSYSSPGFVDIDNDGDLDLFIGEYNGMMYYYSNAGDTDSALWKLLSRKYQYIGADSYSAPAFVDIDDDGDFDLFVGEYEGRIYHYRNDGNNTSLLATPLGFVTDSTGTVIDVGNYSTPAFVDIDNDGDFDLFVGESAGRIYYYRNDGSNTVPSWTPVGFIVNSAGITIDVGSNSVPTFVDIDNDGDFDLFVGESGGRIFYYQNDGNNAVPVWTSVGLITDSTGATIDVGSYSAPAFADKDYAGDLDLFIGEYNGRIVYYQNDGTKNVPSWVLITSNYNSIDLSYYNKPTFVDIDHDGDKDLFIGEQNGMIYFYPQMGHIVHQYTSAGTFNATLRVTDNNALTDTDTVTIRVYNTGSPTARASANPTSGNTPLTVSFKGQGIDPDGTISLYEWDFDGDGTYDWSSTTTGNTTRTYTQVGTYVATLRVTDNDGKTATDSVTIRTSLGVTTTRTGIFNPVNGQTGTITTTLSSDSLISIYIIDSVGNVVRMLVTNASRAAGTYNDVWDGKDDSGKLVKDGIYYFILEHTENSIKQVLDLRANATYTEVTPSRSWPSTFNPFEDNLVTSTYSISKPSEVSMYFWKRDYSRPGSSIAPVRTLFIREPQGAGSHTEVWDGVDDNGVVVGPWSGGYPITLWVYELSDNAIIITGKRPVITTISAEPNYFSPAYNPYGSQPIQYTVVSFNLSEAANIDVKVINSEGIVVRILSKEGLPAGANTIIWDGKDYGGNLVKEGRYSISLVAIDEIGNQSLPRYAAVIVHY